MSETEWTCEGCSKQFFRHKFPSKKTPRFCSRKCAGRVTAALGRAMLTKHMLTDSVEHIAWRNIKSRLLPTTWCHKWYFDKDISQSRSLYSVLGHVVRSIERLIHNG